LDRIRDALRRSPPRRILLVRLGALGDVLHCLPALDALRSIFPGAAIDWVAEPLAASLIEGHPALGRVIRVPRSDLLGIHVPGARGAKALARGAGFLAELRAEEYDLLIDFQGNLRSTAVALCARAPRCIGHHRRETKELTWLVRSARPDAPAGAVHRIEKNLHLVRSLGYEGATPAGRLPPYTDEVERLRPSLEGAPTILHPFVSAFGRFKEWPEERFALLARRLAERGHEVLLTAAPEETARRGRILALAGGAARAAPPTRSARELAALLGLARLVVAADTGPLHIAAFAGVPVVGLFGPKDPAIYGPRSTRSTVRRGAVACAPCRLRTCDHAICMQSISVESVFRACEEVAPSAAAPWGAD
jgi:ADP-heptose:LPS heptosyltransferase